ncbi:MAG: class I SAM-dependent methyltransferase [Defluviitaleaceae bacterium]|nr:class I SAM-dependent methyltransferase [Defluviitaleaceae bacterium]
MGFNVSLCKFLNSKFKLPVHPFNNQQSGKTYAEWQYEKGDDTIAFFRPFVSVDEMFARKTVLDLGCGAAGKTLFYASQGVEKIYGVEILNKYHAEADSLAIKMNLDHLFEFVCADATDLPFKDNSIDTVIMNDSFEHIPDPEKALKEALRVLKPKGRVYINFPPYYHPFGAHLSDAIGIPWVHMLFSDDILINVYRDAVIGLPDGQERLDFRISKDQSGKEYFSYINKLTIRRAKKIVKNLELTPIYRHEEPLRPFLKIFANIPFLKEMFVKMVVYVFEK